MDDIKKYHKIKALSRSLLLQYRSEPEKAVGTWTNGWKDTNVTDSMMFGSFFDTFAFATKHTKSWEDTYYITTQHPEWRTKATKEYVEHIKQTGMIPIRRSWYDKSVIMRHNLLNYTFHTPQFNYLLQYGVKKIADLLKFPHVLQRCKEFTFMDEKCKCLVDLEVTLPDGSITIFDLKSSNEFYSGQWQQFVRHGERFGYDLQASFYLLAYQSDEPPCKLHYRFPFLVSMRDKNHRAVVHEFTLQQLNNFRVEVERLINLHKELTNC